MQAFAFMQAPSTFLRVNKLDLSAGRFRGRAGVSLAMSAASDAMEEVSGLRIIAKMLLPHLQTCFLFQFCTY